MVQCTACEEVSLLLELWHIISPIRGIPITIPSILRQYFVDARKILYSTLKFLSGVFVEKSRHLRSLLFFKETYFFLNNTTKIYPHFSYRVVFEVFLFYRTTPVRKSANILKIKSGKCTICKKSTLKKIHTTNFIPICRIRIRIKG